MDRVVTDARASLEEVVWQRPLAGPGARAVSRSRSGSAGPRLEPLVQTGPAAGTPSSTRPTSAGPHARLSPTSSQPLPAAPSSGSGKPASGVRVAAPAWGSPNSGRPPIPAKATPSSAATSGTSGAAPPAVPSTWLGDEEAELLRELDALDDRLAEKEQILKQIATRESDLRVESEDCHKEVEQLREQAAALELPPATPAPAAAAAEEAAVPKAPAAAPTTAPEAAANVQQPDGPKDTSDGIGEAPAVAAAVAADADNSKRPLKVHLEPGLCVDSEEMVRARLALGLDGSIGEPAAGGRASLGLALGLTEG